MTRNISKANHGYSFECEKCKIKIEGWVKVMKNCDGYCVGRYKLKYCPNCGEEVEKDR